MRDFVYTGHPARVIFSAGSIDRLPQEVERLDLKRVLVLATPRQHALAQGVADRIGERAAGIFASATMHTPVAITEQALAVVVDLAADGIVAIGGGSTVGLGKALALRTDLPQIAIPTTYAGSEMTPILGETKDGVKVTQSTPKVLPETVIYDVELTLGLPPMVSATSGINAIAHAVEALYARDRNPVTDLMAREGVRALVSALPEIADNPSNRAARSEAQYGAWLCGICLGSVGMALHHKLCHTLGGSFDLPHAETHSVVLPHALAYNAPMAHDAVATLGEIFGRADPAFALFELGGALAAPQSLRALGMPEAGIDKATDLALENPYWNPRPLEREAVRACIARAWAGEPPQS